MTKPTRFNTRVPQSIIPTPNNSYTHPLKTTICIGYSPARYPKMVEVLLRLASATASTDKPCSYHMRWVSIFDSGNRTCRAGLPLPGPDRADQTNKRTKMQAEQLWQQKLTPRPNQLKSGLCINVCIFGLRRYPNPDEFCVESTFQIDCLAWFTLLPLEVGNSRTKLHRIRLHAN